MESHSNDSFMLYYRFSMCALHMLMLFWLIADTGLCLKMFLFLTHISFFTNYFFFSLKLSFVMERSGLIELPKYIQFLESHKFSNSVLKFAFSLSMGVAILYWGLVFFAPSFLSDKNTPKILELFLHGGNVVVLLIDCKLSRTQIYFEHQRISNFFLVGFSIFYMVLLYFAYYFLNEAVYPLVSKLSMVQFFIFGICSFCLLKVGAVIFDRTYVKTNID